MFNMENKNIADIVKQALENIRTSADTQTVIGDPINVGDNVTILPVSKVSIGLGIGTGFGKTSNQNAGGGTGLTVTPVAFLVIDKTGDTKLLNVGENTGYDALNIMGAVNGIDIALDKAPDIISKVKALFKKETKDELGTNEKE